MANEANNNTVHTSVKFFFLYINMRKEGSNIERKLCMYFLLGKKKLTFSAFHLYTVDPKLKNFLFTVNVCVYKIKNYL